MKMNIIRMLPFLDSKELKELTNSIINNELVDDAISAHCILPFLEDEEVNLLFDASLAGKIDDNPVGFLPFLEENQITKLVERIQKGEETRISLESVIPFMESDQIKELFRHALDEIKKKPE